MQSKLKFYFVEIVLNCSFEAILHETLKKRSNRTCFSHLVLVCC